MSEQRAREARQRAVRYTCFACGEWYLTDAAGTNLCRCPVVAVPHPPGWWLAERARGPRDPKALAWWDKHIGVPSYWLCGECDRLSRAVAARHRGPAPWEREGEAG